MHALADYGIMYVKLYDDIARHGRIAKAYDYPVIINGRYLMSPSPIPKFDNPKMDSMPALQVFSAGREKRIVESISKYSGRHIGCRYRQNRGVLDAGH